MSYYEGNVLAATAGPIPTVDFIELVSISHGAASDVTIPDNSGDFTFDGPVSASCQIVSSVFRVHWVQPDCGCGPSVVSHQFRPCPSQGDDPAACCDPNGEVPCDDFSQACSNCIDPWNCDSPPMEVAIGITSDLFSGAMTPAQQQAQQMVEWMIGTPFSFSVAGCKTTLDHTFTAADNLPDIIGRRITAEVTYPSGSTPGPNFVLRLFDVNGNETSSIRADGSCLAPFDCEAKLKLRPAVILSNDNGINDSPNEDLQVTVNSQAPFDPNPGEDCDTPV